MGDNLDVGKIGTARTAISMQGSTHACVLRDDDNLTCWGYNPHAQLGRGDTQYQGNGVNEMGDYLQLVDLHFTTTETCPDILTFSPTFSPLLTQHLDQLYPFPPLQLKH